LGGIVTGELHDGAIYAPVAEDVTINNGGILNITSGGTDTTTVVNGGGTLNLAGQSISTKTTATGVTVNAGGVVNVNNLAIANGGIVNSGGQLIDTYGTVSGVYVASGGIEKIVSGGSAFDATVAVGGELDLLGGFIADSQTISAATYVQVSNGRGGLWNVLSGYTIGSGQTWELDYGALENTTVNSGGKLLHYGGADDNTIINAGGVLIVSSWFDQSWYPVVNSGGQLLASYGEVDGATINSGGYAYFGSAVQQSFIATTVIDGGTLEIAQGANIGSIEFASGTESLLKYDGTVFQSTSISGFAKGDTIDLADVKYDSTGSATLFETGTVNIVENGNIYQLHLNPYSEIQDSFQLSNDGQGGTDITLGSGDVFTSGADVVDFNNLTSAQQQAIASGADIYHGLGGDDVVTLPSAANYHESVVSDRTLGWTNTSESTFYTGSLAGDTYTVSGSDGNYFIVEGAGTENIMINGNGSSTITAGSGADTIDITGDGDNTINAGLGSETISISGSGDNVFAGDLNGSAVISGGGTLDVSGDLTGSATIGDQSTLDLLGQINVSSTISFTVDGSSGSETGTGKLTLDDVPATGATIQGFAEGDTVDLSGIVANEDYYDQSTGVLTLYDANYGSGASATDVGSIDFSGDYSANSFTLSSDGSGGTEITLGNPAPTLRELADLANAAYYNYSIVDGFKLVSTTSGISILANGTGVVTSSNNGFSASIYYEGDQTNPDQIVISFRGTDNIKNIIADANTWSTFIKDLDMDQYVALASDVLAQVRQAYPDANITLTGHSLGGALAALVGSASDYPTATFNAPGAEQLIAALTPELVAAVSAKNDLPISDDLPSTSKLPEIDTAYRLEGDQVSLVGTQIGYIETITQTGPQGWLSFKTNHSMSALIANMNNYTVGGLNIPDDKLPAYITEGAKIIVGGFATAFFGPISVIEGAGEFFDPEGSTGYTMTETVGSPLFASIALPYVPDVASYSVSLEYGSTWSSPQTLAPGQTLTPKTAFNGFEFTPLDSSGQTINVGSNIVFDITFASSGTFSGTLSMPVTVATVLEFQSNQATLDQTSGGFDISDSAANVASAFDALNADQNIDGIYLTDNGTPVLNLTDTQAANDTIALGEILNPNVEVVTPDQGSNLIATEDQTISALDPNAPAPTSVTLNGHSLSLAPAAGATLTLTGSISDGGASGNLVLNGPGTVVLSGQNSFSGGITIEQGTLELSAATAAGTGNITFSNDPSLVIDGTTLPTNTISGFAPGDVIDLSSIKYTGGQPTLSNSDVLTFTEGGTTYSLNFDDSVSGEVFSAVADPSGGGTEISLACYCRGTLITSEHGDVAVEDLRVGDLLMTVDGSAKPVVWIGRSTVKARFADPVRSYPIRIKAGALGENVPSRDLLLSPDHALLVEDVLIHAGALVNGTSISRERAVPETFVYYHVELNDHSLILAENTPAETFVDNVDRMNFDNWAEHEALYPEGKPIDEMPYPRAKSHRQVPKAIRAVLDQRAEAIGAMATAAA
jgi:autotransporter-associated beta strand protein/autotransporter passenger strand-loop-strand repeat protein